MKRLLNAFQRLSIRKKLMLSFGTLVIIPTILSVFFSYRMINDIFLENITSVNIESLNKAAKRMDDLVDDVTYTLVYTSSNTTLRKILTESSVESKLTYYNLKQLDAILDQIPLQLSFYGTNITILSDSFNYGNWKEFSRYSASMKESEWYAHLTRSYSQDIMWIGVDNGLFEAYHKELYALEAAIPIKEGKSSVYNAGVLHIAIPEEILYDIIKSNNEFSSSFLVKDNNEILSCADKKLLNIPISNMIDANQLSYRSGWFIDQSANNNKNVVAYTTISKTGWKVITVTPYEKIFAPLFKNRNLLMITTFIFIILFIFVALIISNGISKPIIRLNEKMKKIEQGEFNERIEIAYDDEIGNLSLNFNNMLDKVCELMDLTRRQEREKREAELEVLQAQINPHFLFNTLSSIRWAAAAHGAFKVEEMVLTLSSLLKMTIRKGPDMIPVKEEIDILQQYVHILKMKQGLDFEFRCNLPMEVLHFKIPRLLLQPIVENAILHGFDNKKSGGVIQLHGEIQGDMIKIDICDNGKGMSLEQIETILHGNIVRNKNTYFKNIGIKNVDQRIKLNYGQQYGIKITSNVNMGTMVSLLMPYYKEEEKNAENHVG